MKSLPEHEAGPVLVVTNSTDHPSLMLFAISQARHSGKRILLVHVAPPDVTQKKTPFRVSFSPENGCQDVREQLEYTALRLRWQGILCDPAVLSGDPAEQIMEIARFSSASRLIVGVRRYSPGTEHTGVALAEHLIAELEIPIVILGPRVIALHAANTANSRILVPLSLRHSHSESVQLASSLARETCSRLMLLHVANTCGMTQNQREQAHHSACMQLAALAAKSNLALPIETVVREGDVPRVILQEAICPHQDLIVLGTSGGSGDRVERHAIIHQVIAQAPCPVVVAHSSTRESLGLCEFDTSPTVGCRSKAS